MSDNIGFVNFDGDSGDNNEVEIRIPNDKLKKVQRGIYVDLDSPAQFGGKSYLGRFIAGPFFQPDAISKDSAFARASVLEADKVKLRPDYHGVGKVEILGEIMDKDKWLLSGSSGRPFPQTPVKKLPGEAVQKLLGIEGDVFLGELAGYRGVNVYIGSGRKDVLPRNVGIFGTVGSGKTNTSQVLIEQLASFGWAVIVLDVEGEYVRMDEASEEPSRKPLMKKKMDYFGIEPKGIENIKVIKCPYTESAREELAEEYGIRFANVNPYILTEILEFSTPQMERFTEVYNRVMDRYESKKKTSKKASSFMDKLSDEDESEAITGLTLQEFINEIESRKNDAKGADKSSYTVILRKLKKLKRTGIFDTQEHLGDYSTLLNKGQVSVFDMSDSSNTMVNNIVISTLLEKVFELKNADKKNEKWPPLMIVIEEAHSYISKEKAKAMQETLDVLRDISRRGRKRWLSLCFVTQQPSHLPPEIYELCNTKFVHQTTGGENMKALRNSAGGVNAAIWGDVPVLGQGKGLIISPQFKHPLMVDVRPCCSNRGMTQ